MTIGAYDVKTGKIATAFAGKIPEKIHPELLKRAEMIGGVGTKGVSTKNTVGVCAEFHVVNELLLSGSKISDIKLTHAQYFTSPNNEPAKISPVAANEITNPFVFFLISAFLAFNNKSFYPP